jgi:KDO2-lipid IV(A) lauroyltransferase
MNRILLALLINLWKLLLLLPMLLQKGLIYILSNLIYLMPIKRNEISKKNINLCFPDLSDLERERLHKLNVFESAKVIFYSGIAWFWSDKKINKLVNYEINGLSNLLNEQKCNNGILLFFKHSLHLELDARLLGMNAEIYGVERVHNSDSFDSIQKKGRLKSVKDTCDRNNPMKFIRWLKKGKTVLYATDQDYGLNQSDIVNFFNSPAATISAPLKIIQSTKCKTFFINSFLQNSKYILEVEEVNLDQSSEINFSKDLNLFMENKIRENPEEYLWQHRRFKSTLGKDNFYA